MNKYVFKAHAARRLPDPVFKEATRHVFFCSVLDIPKELPKGANPRSQDDIDRGIYRDIERSLLNNGDNDWTENAFHLRNKGITIIAENVEKKDNDDNLIVSFVSDDEGIVDGAHTYEIIQRNQQKIKEINQKSEVPINQFVKIEIIIGLPSPNMVVEVAGGLNTAVQVQRMSLADLAQQFSWIKEELQDTLYFDKIAFKQGENKKIDVRDILRLLDLFNVIEFRNDQTSSYPTRAYTTKEQVLKHYLDKNYSENYKKLRPILKDVLRLYDTISYQARDLYNEGGGKRAGRLKFVEGDRTFEFPFINETSQHRLSGGALYPMLGAFRATVEIDPVSGNLRWVKGFDYVLKLWEELGKDLMEATQETSEELGRNINAIGKSKKHWAFLHNLVLRRVQR